MNTHGDGVTDDSFSILFAFHQCNDGGHVLFVRDMTYVVGMAMDLTFLRHLDIGMTTHTVAFGVQPWQIPSDHMAYSWATRRRRLGEMPR